jgi:lysozyme family protein
MINRFQVCLPLILQYEGGWADDPQDPGGATMKGVTLAVYEQFKGRMATKDELLHISDADLQAIYRKGYWDALRCDDLPPGVDLVAFDAAVNSGPKKSAKWLQRAAMVADDGVIGPITLKAVRARAASQVINAALDSRLNFLRSLPTFSRYGAGWTRRVADVREKALAVAA